MTDEEQNRIVWDIRSARQPLTTACQSLAELINQACDEIAALRQENEELKTWKAECLKVKRDYGLRDLSKMLGGKPGESCRAILQERLPRVIEENRKLRGMIKDIEAANSNLMYQAGIKDKRIARLGEIQKSIERDLQSHYSALSELRKENGILSNDNIRLRNELEVLKKAKSESSFFGSPEHKEIEKHNIWPKMPRVYEVWREGYKTTDGEGKAAKIGLALGYTFREAVIGFVTPAIELEYGEFDKDKLTLWGCRLFSNEADARKNYG